MIFLQEVLDNCLGHECYLMNEVYYAPIIISRPCNIYGNGAIILCRDSDDIQINSDHVVLNDLYILRDAKGKCAIPLIQCKDDTTFSNVIVHGIIDNGSRMYDDNPLPPLLDLGEFKSEVENSFSYELIVDEECELSSTANCIEITPKHLTVGKNRITIRTDRLNPDVMIYAYLLLAGMVTREILITGVSRKTAEIRRESTLSAYDGSNRVLSEDFLKNELPPNIIGNNLALMKKGQRLIIGNMVSEMRIQLAYDRKSKEMDIDGYLFLLDDSEKARGDNDLIYWNNKTSSCNAVHIVDEGENSFFSVCPNKLPEYVKKIAVCYSIYGNDDSQTFSSVSNPYIRIILDGVENDRYYMPDLQIEKTIIAVEIYLHKGVWKLRCVGSGYRDGLIALCNEYGIEVI